MEILKLYEQSKALHSAQARAMNNDSGISSTPSSAGGSVSSTDTNHGGSDEDLIDFNQSWRRSQYDNWPPPPGKSALAHCWLCTVRTSLDTFESNAFILKTFANVFVPGGKILFPDSLFL